MSISALTSTQGINSAELSELSKTENKVSAAAQQSLALNNQAASQNANKSSLELEPSFPRDLKNALEDLDKKMIRRVFVERLKGIEQKYQDDSLIQKACGLILQSYEKRNSSQPNSPSFSSKLVDIVLEDTDDFLETMVREDVLHILDAISDGTTALGTARRMAKRCVYYNMPVKESILVLVDEKRKETKRISAEEFKSVMKEVRKELELEVYLECFKRREENVKKVFADLKKTLSSPKTIFIGVGASLLLGYAAIRR